MEQQKIQFAVIADLGRNLQYKYIDSSGDYLWGINFGAGVTLFGTYFSISLSIAADHESAAQITLTPEAGGSSRKFSACVCIRLMGGGENTTMDSLSGPGGSISQTAGKMISTSLSLPARYTTNGVFNGLDLKQAVVEVGIGTPNIMYETTNTFGAGLPLKTDFFGDIGRSIGSAAYNFSSWISD